MSRRIPRTRIPVMAKQFVLALDWKKEPWEGVAPRALTRSYHKFSARACDVDNSTVPFGSREAQRIGTDPAQLTLFLKGSPSDGS